MTEPETSAPSAELVADVDRTVFDVLASEARSRGGWELALTTAGASVSATFVWAQHPALHWLASAFAAIAAYGVWGLADRGDEETVASPLALVRIGVLRLVKS